MDKQTEKKMSDGALLVCGAALTLALCVCIEVMSIFLFNL